MTAALIAALVAVLVLVLVALASAETIERPKKNAGAAFTGGGKPCNAWREYKPGDPPPTWAAHGKNYSRLGDTLPGVLDTGSLPLCAGGVVTNMMGAASAGRLGEAMYTTCSVAGDSVEYADAKDGVFLIERDPACGPFRRTLDPAKAFSYKGTPVCYEVLDHSDDVPYWGLLSTHNGKSCSNPGGDIGSVPLGMILDDTVP